MQTIAETLEIIGEGFYNMIPDDFKDKFEVYGRGMYQVVQSGRYSYVSYKYPLTNSISISIDANN